MKNYLPLVLIISAAILACQPEEEIIDRSPSSELHFTSDTVLFDTIFTSIGSVTKRFRVLNPNENAILIDRIYLGGGSDSQYEITLNGRQGDEFENETLLGMDSMLVLVKVNIDPEDQDLPFLVEDSVIFEVNTQRNDVKLLTWGQAANFLNDSILSCESNWTKNRPYVILNNILIDSLCRLTIEKGVEIYLGNASNIFVQGTIVVSGDSVEPVIFSSIRQDEAFINTPGQWGGIFLLEGSKNNKVTHAVIRNGNIGFRIGTPDTDTIPDLVVSNTVIENMLTAGVLSFTSDLLMSNTLVHNCGNWTVANLAGGNYTYHHCTFSDLSLSTFRDEPTVSWSDNLVLNNDELLVDDFYVELRNSIIWGVLENEISLSASQQANFTILTGNNILKTDLTDIFETQNILNLNPKFLQPRTGNYRLDTLSPAIDAGVELGYPFDLRGKPRDQQPDLGAFERIENP